MRLNPADVPRPPADIARLRATRWARWRAAFAVRQNVRQLFVPPHRDQLPLYGLRALVILWTLVMHIFYLAPAQVPRSNWLRLAADPSYRWIHRGELAVDGFFVLSGYLIAYFLIAEHRRRGTIAIGRFYVHRFLRLAPVLWVSLVIYAALDGQNLNMCWSNILYVNNFVPFGSQCMPWTWSLAVEEQFYLTFPLFLLVFLRWTRWRLAALAALFGLACVIRAVVIWRHGLQLPIALDEAVQGPGRLAPQWATYADALYVKPYTRFGALLCGIVVAYLRHFTGIDAAIRRRPLAASAALAGALAAIALVIAAPMHDLRSVWSPAASLLYLTGHRYLFSLALAGVLLLCLNPAGLGKPLAWLLSRRFWYPLAITAYANYLLQPIVVERFFYSLAKYLRDNDMNQPALGGATIALLFCILTPLIFVLCAVLYVFVEVPFLSLRRHSLSSTPVPGPDEAVPGVRAGIESNPGEDKLAASPVT